MAVVLPHPVVGYKPWAGAEAEGYVVMSVVIPVQKQSDWEARHFL